MAAQQVKPFHLMKGPEQVNTRFTTNIDILRTTFASGKTKRLQWRIQQLQKLEQFILDKYDSLIKSMASDLQKCRLESVIYELDFVLNDIRGALTEIGGWVKPEVTPKTLMTALDTSFIHNEPFGLALILGAWNYPVQLIVSPLVGAIAAGNCCVIKPSELSPETAKIMASVTDYLDPEAFFTINGGVEDATELLKEKYDFIFYTGSVGVGKIVYAAAQKHLTPVVLELGGKSPVYVHSDVDIDVSVRRILWGKFVNAGQTCVAPDYALCHEAIYDKFISTTHKIVKEFFGEDPIKSKDFGRIVTPRHAERLVRLLQGADIVLGGDSDTAQRYVAPTVVKDVKPSDPLMQEELFGPILPIMKVSGIDEAISYINSHDKPLAAYPFASDKHIIKKFIDETSSGSVCANDTLVHLSIENLPFGGVGNSGMGRYHGKHSFDTFSNKKAVLQRDFAWIGEAIGQRRYPPYSEANLEFFKLILKRRTNYFGPLLAPIMWIFVGVVISSLIQAIWK